jgi:hypothetical protein
MFSVLARTSRVRTIGVTNSAHLTPAPRRRIAEPGEGAQTPTAIINDSRSPMPSVDHKLILENLWVVISISLGLGGLIGEVSGFLHGNLGCGAKIVIGASFALLIFGSIWFFAPAS